MVRRDDVDVDAASPERSRDLEPDETRSNHDDVLRALRAFDDRAAVGPRAEVMHLLAIATRNGEADRIGTRRDEQRTKLAWRSVLDGHGPCTRINRRHSRIQQELDVLMRVHVGRPERKPIILRLPSEKVLREVWTV